MTDDKRAGRPLSEWAKIAPPPEIPVWVPEGMKEPLRLTLYARTSNLAEVARLKRLATDPRMKKVWVELTKKSRSKGEDKFFHSTPREVEMDGGAGLRFTVLELLFRDIFILAKGCFSDDPGGLPKGLKQHCDAFTQTVTQLDNHAWFVRWMARRTKGGNRAKCAKLAKHLDKAALAYEEILGLLHTDCFDNNALVAILFCRKTAIKMRDTLGSPKYGLVSIIASVILDREITPSDVRQWCSGPWGIPKQRTNSP